jgi:hypothetical protein
MARHWWITPVILASPEAEIRKIVVRGQPGQIVRVTLSPKFPNQKRAGEWLKWESTCIASMKPSSNPHTKKKKKNTSMVPGSWTVPQGL